MQIKRANHNNQAGAGNAQQTQMEEEEFEDDVVLVKKILERNRVAGEKEKQQVVR